MNNLSIEKLYQELHLIGNENKQVTLTMYEWLNLVNELDFFAHNSQDPQLYNTSQNIKNQLLKKNNWKYFKAVRKDLSNWQKNI